MKFNKQNILIGTIFLIGILTLLYSFTLEPYIDIKAFHQKYMTLTVGQTKEFYVLRESMLTPKYYLHDFGILLILLSFILFIFLKLGKGYIVTPKNKFLTVLLALSLPILTTSGFVFDLFLGMERNEYPWWSDTLAIPLSGTPVIFIFLLLWSLLHLQFISNKEVTAKPIKFNQIKKINPWLLIVSILTFTLFILTILEALYWYTIPGLLWLYYYLSLGLINSQEK